MSFKLLVTSFQTWLPHQISNSSDDLLDIIQNNYGYLDYLYLLRKLPVNTNLAAQAVKQTIETINPQGVICCGMAESRKILTIESQAIGQEKSLTTNVNLKSLLGQLYYTKISHDAGKFVCEGLYYEILHHIQTQELSVPCIFVHVPLLNEDNLPQIAQDFHQIIQYFKSRSNY